MSTYALLSSSLSETATSLLEPVLDAEHFGTAASKLEFKSEKERHEYLHRFDGELYPKNISRRMLATSCAMSVAAIQAYLYECYTLSIAVWFVVFMSINYWRAPVRNWRRSVDIVNSISMSSYHMIYAVATIDNVTALHYVGLVLSGLILFFASKICAQNGLMHLDSFWHCTMHLYGTAVNCWFYQKVYEYRMFAQ